MFQSFARLQEAQREIASLNQELFARQQAWEARDSYLRPRMRELMLINERLTKRNIQSEKTNENHLKTIQSVDTSTFEGIIAGLNENLITLELYLICLFCFGKRYHSRCYF